ARKSAEFLFETLSAYDPATLKDRVDAMHRIENEADMAKHEMTRRLTHEFITPLEREDIIALSQEMDNVVDAAEDVLQRAYMFNITKIRPETIAFAELFVKCSAALAATLDELGNFKKVSSDINKHVVEVNALESVGDTMHNENIRRLFTEETDARELLIWSNMFECFENCLDACEHAADVVETLIMKNT
ncbi:MAG: DUF47 family protein, partial [Clostridia bacterium]|nr:DUF47 family protein [Clostridia bacterium]